MNEKQNLFRDYVTRDELKKFINIKIRELMYLINDIEPMPIKVIIVKGKVEKIYSHRENMMLLCFHEKIVSLRDLVFKIEKDEENKKYYASDMNKDFKYGGQNGG